MIVQMHSHFHVSNKADAVAQAEEIWRKFTGDPVAELPWATTIHVEPAETAAPTLSGEITDPRPFFVDLIIKDTKPETKAPPGAR